MNEKIIQFGDNQGLIGVLTSPESMQKDKPIFIFVNSGLLHRVGPFRIYVEAARVLAKQQVTSFRMDLSGKGDSLPKQNSLSLKENTNQDIIDAMDHLQENTGIASFVVCGICTGADNAYEIAFNDDRVKGVIPIDGYAYPTTKFHIKKMFLRICNSNSWKNIANKFLPFRSKNDDRISRINKSDVTTDYRMIFPDKVIFEKDMLQALKRETLFLIIFTGGWYMFYNYPKQFENSISTLFSAEKIEVVHNIKSDHTFILQKDTDWLISTILVWTKKNF